MSKILTPSGWKQLDESVKHVNGLIDRHINAMANTNDPMKYHIDNREALKAELNKHSGKTIIDACKKHCDRYNPKGNSFAHGIIADHNSGKSKIRDPANFAAELAERSGRKTHADIMMAAKASILAKK